MQTHIQTKKKQTHKTKTIKQTDCGINKWNN